MPPTFLLFLGFVAAILLAPVVLAVALACISIGQPQLGRPLLAWGALGAVGYVLASLGLGLGFGDHATAGGLLAGAAAGFTVVSLSAVAIRWWRARRVR